MNKVRQFGEKLNLIFRSNMIFFMAGAMVIGWHFNSFSSYRTMVPWMFGYMTLVTALKTSWNDLSSIIKNPLPLFTIILIQHAMLPFVAKFLGQLGFPDHPALIAGFVLTAALPVGITAVIWTGLSKGEVALSLTAATVDTLMSPITISTIMFLFIGKSININYAAMMSALVKMVVIPSAIGLTINDLSKGKFHEKYIPYLGPFSSIALCCVIMVNVATAQATASSLVSAAPKLLLFTLALVSTGFVAGLLIPRLLGFSEEMQTSCVYCIGIRNTSSGLVIALGYLPPEASIPLLVSMFFQQPIAALFQKITLHYELRSKQAKINM